MTSKMMWLFVWVTLTLWLSNFWGCAAPSSMDKHETASTQPTDKGAALSIAFREPETGGVVLPNELSRKDWPVVSFEGVDGVVTHYPIYYRDCVFDADETAAFEGDRLQAKFRAALAGDLDESCYCSKAKHSGLQIGKFFLVDTIALPVRMAMQPPWTLVSTPASAASTDGSTATSDVPVEEPTDKPADGHTPTENIETKDAA